MSGSPSVKIPRLQEEKKRLSNVQKLMESSARAHDRLYGKSSCVLEELRGVIADIREIKKIDTTLSLSETGHGEPVLSIGGCGPDPA